MKRVVDSKGRKQTVFLTYNIGEDGRSCPQCHRIFKENNIKWFKENKRIRCPKCNSLLLP